MSPSYTAEKLRMGAQIRDMRMRVKKSQERIAAEVGTTRRNWIRWEQGETRPSPLFMSRIAVALGVDESVFSEEEEADSLGPLEFLETLMELARERRHRKAAGGLGEPGGFSGGWAGANSRPGSPNPTMRTVS